MSVSHVNHPIPVQSQIDYRQSSFSAEIQFGSAETDQPIPIGVDKLHGDTNIAKESFFAATIQRNDDRRADEDNRSAAMGGNRNSTTDATLSNESLKIADGNGASTKAANGGVEINERNGGKNVNQSTTPAGLKTPDMKVNTDARRTIGSAETAEPITNTSGKIQTKSTARMDEQKVETIVVDTRNASAAETNGRNSSGIEKRLAGTASKN